jgi:hypothetical protein
MTSTNPFERLVEDWLTSAAPATVPGGLQAAVVRAVRGTRQHRPRFGFSRGGDVLAAARLLVDFAAVVVLIVVAVNLLPGRGGGGTTATATPPGTAPAETERVQASPSPLADPFWAAYAVGVRQSVRIDGVSFSIVISGGGWENYRGFLIAKSLMGPQGAEAIVFFAGFPDGVEADPCATLSDPPIRVAPRFVAEAVSTAPGIEVVSPPTEVTLGGRAAVHVVVKVREDLGCDPGYFYNWKAQTVGALWPETVSGDTIRVWVVDVDGASFFIGALTNVGADGGLDREIAEIVGSIQFE